VANVLNVSHFQQEAKAGCLPACVQMVLAYLGVSRSQDDLARSLDTRPYIGTIHSRITRLRSADLDVIYSANGTLDDLAAWLSRRVPVLAFVQMRELPYWHGRWSQHAIVVIGLNDITVHLLDPAAQAAVISVPVGHFLLAWGEMDYTYAVIVRRT